MRSIDIVVVQTVLVHDPFSLVAVRGPARVENEGFPHPDSLVRVGHEDGLVSPCCLPETRHRSPIRSGARWVLFVLVAEEVPLILGTRPDSAFLCIVAYLH